MYVRGDEWMNEGKRLEIPCLNYTLESSGAMHMKKGLHTQSPKLLFVRIFVLGIQHNFGGNGLVGEEILCSCRLLSEIRGVFELPREEKTRQQCCFANPLNGFIETRQIPSFNPPSAIPLRMVPLIHPRL